MSSASTACLLSRPFMILSRPIMMCLPKCRSWGLAVPHVVGHPIRLRIAGRCMPRKLATGIWVPPSCITAKRLRHLDRRLKHLLQRDGEPQILPRNPRPHHLLTPILSFRELDRRKWRMRMSRNSNDISGSIVYWRNVAGG